MRVHEIFLTEKKHEWRVSSQGGEISAVLFTDYENPESFSKGFQYAAEFVHAREDGYEFYSQKVHNAGDRIEWGGEHTKTKRFKTRSEVNAFLRKVNLPELTDQQFSELHPDNTIVICVKGSGGMSTDHFFTFGPILKTAKESSKTEEEFMGVILRKLKELTKNWTFGSVRNWDRISGASVKALKEYYATGKTNKF